MVHSLLFNSLHFNDIYDYKKLGFITLICKYTRNNCFLTLKNKFGTVLCISCGFIEKTTTRKKRAYSTFLALLNYLIDLCKKKKIITINNVFIYQTPDFPSRLIKRRLQPISYLFYINKIKINKFRIIFNTPHHLSKKRKKIRRK